MSSLWRLHPCIPVTWITHLNVTTLQWIFVWIEGNFCKTAIVQTCFLGFPNCCTIMIPFTESRNKSLMNHPKRNKITQLTIQDAQCIFFFKPTCIIYHHLLPKNYPDVGKNRSVPWIPWGPLLLTKFAFGGGDLKAFFVSDDPASRWASIERCESNL